MTRIPTLAEKALSSRLITHKQPLSYAEIVERLQDADTALYSAAMWVYKHDTRKEVIT